MGSTMLLHTSTVLLSLAVLAAAEDCITILGESDLVTLDFPEIVVHGVHSITLENIRHYFDPEAGEDNGIPVVNMNLTQPDKVLLSAPSVPLTNPFTSPTMDTVDQVLSHMTDNDWDIRNALPLERLVHALHMLEVWETAAPHYTEWGRGPQRRKKTKTLKKLCPCLTDVEEIGVLGMLNSLADKMRDTRIIWRYGPNPSYAGGGGGFLPGRQPSFFEMQMQMQIRSLGQVVPNTDKPATNLTNEAEWEIWKNNMDMTAERESKSQQLALFLYCKLNTERWAEEE